MSDERPEPDVLEARPLSLKQARALALKAKTERKEAEKELRIARKKERKWLRGQLAEADARERRQVVDSEVNELIIQGLAQIARKGEARQRAPLAAKKAAKETKIARAVELHKGGNSPARIAQIMSDAGLISGEKDPARSVRRWLGEAKNRTDREVSDSR